MKKKMELLFFGILGFAIGIIIFCVFLVISDNISNKHRWTELIEGINYFEEHADGLLPYITPIDKIIDLNEQGDPSTKPL